MVYCLHRLTLSTALCDVIVLNHSALSHPFTHIYEAVQTTLYTTLILSIPVKHLQTDKQNPFEQSNYHQVCGI